MNKNFIYKNIISINKNIHNKISKLEEIITYMCKKKLHNISKLKHLKKKLCKLKDKYILSTVEYINKFYNYMENGNTDMCSSVSNKYIFWINSNNVENILNYIKDEIISIISNFDIDDLNHYSNIEFQLKKFNNINIQYYIKQNDKIKCDNCSKELQIPNDTNEIKCEKCGVLIKIYNIYNINLNNSNNFGKINSYIPTKHCKEWINRIQAKEKIKIPDKVILKIKKHLKENNINCKRLYYYEIRNMLRTLNLSKYNENIPLLKKIITGRKPCQLTSKEEETICFYFKKVSNIYLKIKPSSKTNVPYHPYLIFKIIEQILKPGYRKKEILSNIYLQSRETIIDKDKLWKIICSHIENFKYIPTDKFKYQNI